MSDTSSPFGSGLARRGHGSRQVDDRTTRRSAAPVGAARRSPEPERRNEVLRTAPQDTRTRTDHAHPRV